MPRHSTLAQRQRRFLLPFISISLPPLAILIALRMFENGICEFLAQKAPKAACDLIPDSVPYMLGAAVLFGIAISFYCFYLDHIHGHAYDDLY